jgi:hypothetical protein
MIASGLPGQIGSVLLEVARAAFTQAMVLTSAVSVALAIIAAIVVGMLLRDVAVPTEETESDAKNGASS